ncbi:MAG: hypothetical protein HY352_06445 [Candidatus Omnitrophica bacterium]|nr:hypothetical protein [Candidatus Omnitrophota bacterium]
MAATKIRWISTVCCVVCSVLAAATAQAASVEHIDGLRVVHLSGTPYELGKQHGALLRDEVREAVTKVLGYFRGYLKIPGIRTWAANWWLEYAWKQARPFIPQDHLEELRGLADGSGVSLEDLYRLHAVPDRTYSCSSFAAWGRATADGRLIHVRNLDWSIKAGIQQFPVVFVVRPAGKHAFVNIGWAGFIGVLTGVNDEQMSVGQVGAETKDDSFRGEPMVFLMRRVLETADDLDAATTLVRQATRTIGVNYVFADADAHRAIALETTHRYVRVFEANDPAEHRVPYARPIVDAVFRADTAVDPVIRDQQLASDGDPGHPGLERPGGSAYETRYLGQAAGLSAYFGTLDAEKARQIAQAIAPGSNIQSVVFAWPDVWIANAQGTTPAARTPYHHLNLAQLLTASDP